MLLVIYTGILFYSVQPMLKANSSTFYLPVETTYYDSIDGDFLAIKDETVFSSSKITGSANYEEGTRLRRGIIKAGIAENEEYYEISKKISELEDTKAMFTSEITDIDKNLRQAIIREDYNSLKKLVNSFGYKVLKDGNLTNASKIDEEIEKLRVKLNSLSSAEVWNPAGIISYDMDGYEYLKIDDFENIKYEEFVDVLSRPNLDINQKDFKIVDNFRVLFIVHFPNSQELVDLNGRRINISIDDHNSFLSARVIIPSNYDKDGLVGFLVDNHIEDIYSIRRGKLSAVFNSVPAFRIPTQAIVEYNGKQGVVVKDVNGIIRFRPVEIYKSQQDFTFISRGNARTEIGPEANPERTIVFYEEIILNPNLNRIDTIYWGG